MMPCDQRQMLFLRKEIGRSSSIKDFSMHLRTDITTHAYVYICIHMCITTHALAEMK